MGSKGHNLQNEWSFDDIDLGTQEHLLSASLSPEPPETLISDSEETLFVTQSPPDEDTARIKLEEPGARFPWRMMPEERIELSDDDEPVRIKAEPAEKRYSWVAMKDRLVELSESEDEPSESHKARKLTEPEAVRLTKKSLTATETINDSDGVQVKAEPSEVPFSWKTMHKGTVMIADGEDKDDVLILDDGSMVPIKKEKDVMPFSWTEVIDLDAEEKQAYPTKSILGKSFLNGNINAPRLRGPVEKAKMAECQRMFAERALGRPLSIGRGDPPGNTQMPKRPDLQPDHHDDDFSWMTNEYKGDENAAQEFRALKQAYKAKVKADENTSEDDLEFTKAQNIEATRLKRLRLEYERNIGMHSGEGSDSDDEFSVTLSSVQKPKQRPAAVNVPDNDIPIQGGKKRKRNNKGAVTGGKDKVLDLEKELEMNMMAGIQCYIKNKDKGKGGKANDKSTKGTNAKEGAKMKGRKKLVKEGSGKKRRTQDGYLNDAGSLLTSNVFEDFKNNKGSGRVLHSNEKNKTRFLAAMVSGLSQNDSRREEKNHIKKCTAILGHGRIMPADNGTEWAMKGMKSSLRHHQVQGSAWMKQREIGIDEPFGGILADAMGLGKTVQTIALMIANPPTRNDKSKCTLIVCQPGLVQQWYDELSKHAEDDTFPCIWRYHAGMRLGGKGIVQDMERANVAITTYQEVVRSYPKVDIPVELGDLTELKEWWRTIWNEGRDVLHQAHFYRVVLDESQAIKNHLSQTSIACRALMAKHRWALSGTPIMNRLEELYPYFKYLRIEGTGSYTDFQQFYCQDGSDECNKRLHCLLDQVMLRRTMGDKVLGEKIVDLPAFHQEEERLHFNIVEESVYSIISRRYIRAINKSAANGEMSKINKPGYGIVMFLRLRQMAAHLFLIQEILQDIFSVESIDRLEEACIRGPNDVNEHGRTLIAALRRMVEAKGNPVEEISEAEDIEAPNGELATELGKKIRKLRDNGKFDEVKEEILCHKCRGIAEVPWVTSCLHVYCRECLVFLAYDACNKGLDTTDCRECGTNFARSEPCSGLKELQLDDFLDLTPNLAGRRGRKTKVNMSWVAYDDNLVLSTKTIGVQAQIIKWLAEDPEAKIIIFSEFHMIIQIMERVCQRQGWEYCSYHGKMSHEARNKVIGAFGEAGSKIKIMVASLKCGGIGLNLTMASRVTCVDLWFNSCVERQAFCRVFRIGQTSETFVTRFIINDSVDDRLEAMQKRKERIIGAAMDDRDVLTKLSATEVMRLFGEVMIDKNTKRPFIAIEDDERLDAILPPPRDDEDDPIIPKI